MDGSVVRARARPQGVAYQGQVALGTFSHPPGIRRNATPPLQRNSSRWRVASRFASRSAHSRRMRIWAIMASRLGSASVFGGSAGMADVVVTDDAGGALNRVFQASPVLTCSQIPAPAMPSSRTAHKPSQGNSQRVRGMDSRYSGRSRSIRPPKASCAHCSRGVGAPPLRERFTRAGVVSAPVPAGLLSVARRWGQPSPSPNAVCAGSQRPAD